MGMMIIAIVKVQYLFRHIYFDKKYNSLSDMNSTMDVNVKHFNIETPYVLLMFNYC
jgi:hypothetical protein